MAGGLWLIPG